MAGEAESVVAFWETLPGLAGEGAYDVCGNLLCRIRHKGFSGPYAINFHESIKRKALAADYCPDGGRLAHWMVEAERVFNEIMPAIYAEALAKAGQE